MPRRSLTREQIDWVVANHQRMKLVDLARHTGFCTDTLRRVLVREGAASFNGAKYAISRSSQSTKWTRPCLRCRDDAPRPRNQYLCSACHNEIEGLIDV